MICENAAEQFVQFARSDGEICLDLRTRTLTPRQITAAVSLFAEIYQSGRVDLDDKDFSFQVKMPPEAAFSCATCRTCSRRVCGAVPTGPFKITVDKF